MHMLIALHPIAVADQCLTFRHLAHWTATKPTHCSPAAPTAAQPAAAVPSSKIEAYMTNVPSKGNIQCHDGKSVCQSSAYGPAGNPPASSGIPSQPSSAVSCARAAPSTSRLLPFSRKAAPANQTGSAMGTTGHSTPYKRPAVVGGFLRRGLQVSVTCLTSSTPIEPTPATPQAAAHHAPAPRVNPKAALQNPVADVANTNPACAITLAQSTAPESTKHEMAIAIHSKATAVPSTAVPTPSAVVAPTPSLVSAHGSHPSQGAASPEPQPPAVFMNIGRLTATRLCEADSESVQAPCDMMPLAHYVVDALGRRGCKSHNRVMSQWGQISAGNGGHFTKLPAILAVLYIWL